MDLENHNTPENAKYFAYGIVNHRKCPVHKNMSRNVSMKNNSQSAIYRRNKEEMRTIKLLSVLIGSTPAGPSALCSIRLRNHEHGGGIVRDSDLQWPDVFTASSSLPI